MMKKVAYESISKFQTNFGLIKFDLPKLFSCDIVKFIQASNSRKRRSAQKSTYIIQFKMSRNTTVCATRSWHEASFH